MAHLHLDIPAAVLLFYLLSATLSSFMNFFCLHWNPNTRYELLPQRAEMCRHYISRAVMLCSHTTAAAALVRRQLESGKLCADEAGARRVDITRASRGLSAARGVTVSELRAGSRAGSGHGECLELGHGTRHELQVTRSRLGDLS